MRLRREHPEWEERWYAGTVASTLEKQVAEAIEAHRPFAFETNFSSRMPVYLAQRFKDAGYKYTEGLRQTVANLHLFDNLTFIDGTTTYGQIVAIYISASRHFLLSEPRPQWFDEHFAQPLQEIVEEGEGNHN